MKLSDIVARFRRKPVENNIGAILLHLGFITRDQLLDAITTKHRKDPEALLGEILIAQSAVTRQQLERALEIQRARRGTEFDYVGRVRDLVAGVHAQNETVQAKLDELKDRAENLARTGPKLRAVK